jgi:hypothetical protein
LIAGRRKFSTDLMEIKGSMKRNGIAAGAGFKGSVEQTREPSRWTTT